MLSIDKLSAVTKIVTHSACPDGIASAMILRDVYPSAEIQFVQYSTPALDELLAEPGMLFCDITPPYNHVMEFIDAGVMVLDHHRTTKDTVAKFGGNGVFGDELEDPGVSGAVLAYRHVWLPMRGNDTDGRVRALIEDFATLAGIRDTWQKHHPRWQDAVTQAHALMFLPQESMVKEHSNLGGFLETDWDKYLWAGRIRGEAFKLECQRAIDTGFRFVTESGIRVLLVNGTRLASDVSDLVGHSQDLVMAYKLLCEGNRPKIVFSLRSNSGFDCAKMAEYMGGGGHTRSAGFSIWDPDDNPFDLAQRILQRYERAKRITR
jgi:hypothetical protein